MAPHYDEAKKSTPYLPFRIGHLSKDIAAIAERELGETESTRAETIPELRKLVKDETDLFCPVDDDYLLQYLRPRKFDVKKAFSLIQTAYGVKRDFADIYDDCSTENLGKFFNSKIITFLPYRDEAGSVIMVIKMSNWNPDKCSISEFANAFGLAIFHCNEDPATQVCGLRIFIDVRGMNLKQVRCITPRYLFLFSRALRNSTPVRITSIHLYKDSSVILYVWSVLKLFLSDKIKNRIHFHGSNLKQLHKFIPKALLPEEYGGEYPQDIFNWYNDEVVKFFDKFNELKSYGYGKKK